MEGRKVEVLGRRRRRRSKVGKEGRMKGEENLNLRSKEERMVDALALKDDEGREKLR